MPQQDERRKWRKDVKPKGDKCHPVVFSIPNVWVFFFHFNLCIYFSHWLNLSSFIKTNKAVSCFGCCGRPNITALVWLYSHSHQVFWQGMSMRRRPKGHWWLIFWALTDCVSNGALIAFAPPSLQTSPKKSIQIPTRKVVPWERSSGPSLRHSQQRGIGLMCNLKSISLKKNAYPTYDGII